MVRLYKYLFSRHTYLILASTIHLISSSDKNIFSQNKIHFKITNIISKNGTVVKAKYTVCNDELFS